MPEPKKKKNSGANKKPQPTKNKKVNNKVLMQKKKRRLKILKWTSLIILLAGSIAFILLSSLFNIKEITVSGNNRIEAKDIVSLSGIQTGENMFRFLKIKAKEKIKQNPYIEEVSIRRKIDGIIQIKVIEREPTYMLSAEEKFVYINNQGYMLEESTEKLDKPVITGYETTDVKPGNRLDVKDLEKLGIAIQIMKAAESKDLKDKITGIDITDSNDFLLKIDSENKIIHFGNSNNINEKFLRISAVLKNTEGQKGEIFVNNIEKVYFREEVSQ